MSNYTTELRYICEDLTKMYGQPYKTVIPAARPLLFDFEYPFYAAEDKVRFEEMIMKHFYTREIGYETPGRFRLGLDSKLNEIMPFYNKMYKAFLKDFNFLDTHEINIENDSKVHTDTQSKITNEYDTHGHTQGDLSVDETNSDDNTETTNYRESDTPQGDLNAAITADYLSKASNNVVETDNVKTIDRDSHEIQDTTTETNSESQSNGKQDSTQESTHKETGRSGFAPGTLLSSYYNAIKNIDKMILEELEELFMSIW